MRETFLREIVISAKKKLSVHTVRRANILFTARNVTGNIWAKTYPQDLPPATHLRIRYASLR